MRPIWRFGRSWLTERVGRFLTWGAGPAGSGCILRGVAIGLWGWIGTPICLLLLARERPGWLWRWSLGTLGGLSWGGSSGWCLLPCSSCSFSRELTERVDCLRCVAGHLRPGGIAAPAIVEEVPVAEVGSVALPDVREADGWVYSSLPIETGVEDGSIVVRRLRQVVSPAGELSEEIYEVGLRRLSAGTVEREAVEAGLVPAGRREIPATDAHVGSTVVLLERGA